MSVLLEAEVIEIRKIPRDIVEVSLVSKKVVRPVTPEETLIGEESYVPEHFIKMMRKAFEKFSEYTHPEIILRLSFDQYKELGKPVIGDKLRIKIEKI